MLGGKHVFRGDRLASQRKSKRLTQEELAVKINLTKAAVSNYENGHSTPSNETLVAIADALDVDTDYLLGRTELPREELSRSKPDLSEETTEYVLKELVEKYKIDLTDSNKRDTLEKMIKLVYEDL
ncbi:helix-turn-helix domain-containing protein [Paenibacillus barcinonensis]|nr:helix-turn-helix domain-containing protein [Paenibacillus barcinonensis]